MTSVAAGAILLLVAGCTSFGGGSTTNSTASGCNDLLNEARRLVATGQTGDGQLDWTIDELAFRCDAEYDVFIDEVARTFVEESGVPEGVEPAPVTSGPTGSIPWNVAITRVGTVQYVCGPLVNRGTSDDDVFLNLGLGYPEVGRFTIVLWDVGAIEQISPGTTLCTTGTITNYQGTAQIELSNPGAVEIWE